MLQSTSTGNILRDLPSALAIARYIEDINCITYPEGIKSPKVELNVNAQHGKFLYDRDFLLQFMNVCKEKPDFITPPDVLGLEPRDTSYSMSQGGSGHSPTSNTMSIPGDVGSASIGLGILPGSVGKSADSGFQMGQFSTSAGKMSSEERFLAASARRSASVSGGPPMEPVTPLEVATNRWVATSAHDYDSGLDSEPPKVVERKVKALLNKLTVEHFDSISDQIIACANESKDGRALLQVTKLVFEKATDEATASEMCARLCRKMVEQISPKVQDDGIKNSEGKPFAGGNLFRKYLLNRCQEDFERGWIAKETTAAAAATKATADQAAKEAKEKTKGDEESELYSDEYYAAAMAQRRGLGLIRFIGELFKLQMLTERIMHECIKKLFGNAENPGEEEIESLCNLLITVGSLLDTPKARAHVDVYFSRMRALTKNKNVNARMVFMLQEVIELRKHKWIPREAVAAPTTIAQVHEAAKEKLAQEKDPFMRQNASTSRGGSRRASGSRDVADAPHPDGLSVADTGAACVQSKAGTVDPPTPTSSRPPGHKHGVDLGVGGSPEPSPQQRKLKLLPRTKSKRKKSKKSAPTVSEVGPDDEAAGEGGTSAPNTISEGEAKLKIDEDVKEFFSIRMFHEAESYFSGLPTEHRHRLVDALVMKSVEMKDSDVELVGDLFVRVREKDLCSPAAFEEGFNGLAELLDDLAVDIPKAWSYFAILLKGSGLDQDEERYARIAEKTLDPDRLNQVM
ncbi:ARM repeat-containing protein [Lactarius psammicola]|nr:ARM repeat-containing protein [Lactarius psammicola]